MRALTISSRPSRACHSRNRVGQGLGEMSSTPRNTVAISASIGFPASG